LLDPARVVKALVSPRVRARKTFEVLLGIRCEDRDGIGEEKVVVTEQIAE
jgi:hypothetical protein